MAMQLACIYKETTMSAPQTNVERQKRRHAGPLIGMVIAAILAVLALFYYMTFDAETVPTPEIALPLTQGDAAPQDSK